MNPKRIEVLSPVGSPETLIAAVRCGADAVYLGSKAFSARRNAENFDNTALKEAVRFCHIRGVKVYLTHNIMCRESELSDAVELARFAQGVGVDGLIIQDLGLAAAIRRTCPDIELHASTQMSLHSPAALPILKSLGFSRVVAAREMNKRQLSEFCSAARALEMEVEVFVHGALCMSVSGQCLLSSMLGGRSGNRGLCAGPCRLPFKAQGGTGFDLSLKDLSLTEHINELSEMGVASLKIEGRMKRPEYVAASTSAIRSAVDSGFVPQDIETALLNVFSRSGFTDSYFTGRLSRDMFGIRTKDDVEKAGGSFAFLHELYRRERQSVPISIKAAITVGEPIKLSISDGPNTVSVTGEIVSEAKSRPITKEGISDALSKLGSTPYFAKDVEVSVSGDAFVPNSLLNSLRREAAEKLDQLRGMVKNCTTNEYVNMGGGKKVFDSNPRLIARVPSAEMIASNVQGVTFMVPSEKIIGEKITVNGVIAELPRFIENETKLKEQISELKKIGINSAFCGNLSAVALCKEAGLEVIGGMGLNVCNSETVGALRLLGVDSVTLTPEMPLSNAVKLGGGLPSGIFAYGRLPLMLLRSCPLRNGRSCAECVGKGTLTDRLDVKFPIICRGGVSELLNSKPHFLADRLSETRGLDFLLLYFTDESPEQIDRIISIYKNGGKPDFDYTRGAYFRETL